MGSSGIITCEAKTEHGAVKCQFDTTISDKRSDAPSFLSQPKSQNVNAGQNVTFKCEVSGEPSPEVEWLKDNVVISITSNMNLSRSKNVYTLEIQETTATDSGKYTVKAKNQYGQCSATASLNVLALVEEPVKMIVMEKASASESLQGSLSATAVHMASSVQESSFSSSSMSKVQFESMSASMSSMSSESMVAMSSEAVMSSSSVTEMSATHSHTEGSTSL